MALVAWYPLNRDLKNYGSGENGTDLDNVGITINNNGKLGKCFYFQRPKKLLNGIHFKELEKAKIFSFGCWINFDKDNTDWAKSVFLETSSDSEDDNSSHNGIRFECFYTQKENSQFGVFDYPSYHHIMKDANISSQGIITLPDEWHHFMFVADGEHCYFYKDGIVIGDCEQEKSGYLTGNIWIGEDANATVLCYCKMNDVRIYNHALSQSEVKEIYRSLILKYSFDTPVVDPKISMARTTNISNLLDGGTNRCAIIGDVIYNRKYFVDNNYVTISFDLNIKDIAPLETNKGRLSIQGRTVIDGTEKWGTFVSVANELYGRSMQLRIYRRNNKLHKLIRKWIISYRKML